METQQRGDATEATVIAELIQRGISVSLPFGDNERYDIVVTAPEDRLLRVQIKTGWFRDGYIEFHGKSQHTNSTGNTYKTYTGDVEYFLVYVPELETMYLIGEDEFNTAIRLRVDEPKQRHETIHWAEEYEFDQRWPPDMEDESRTSNSRTVEKALSLLCEHGLDVARSVTIDSYHLLVDMSPELIRLSVATGWVQDGRLRFQPRSNVDRERVDWFLVYCDELDAGYLVAPDEFDTSISLRVAEPDRDHPSINWAEEYLLEERWPFE